MIKVLGIFMMLAGMMIWVLGTYSPMENMGTVGTIDGETWVRYSMQAAGIAAMILGVMVNLVPNRRYARR